MTHWTSLRIKILPSRQTCQGDHLLMPATCPSQALLSVSERHITLYNLRLKLVKGKQLSKLMTILLPRDGQSPLTGLAVHYKSKAAYFTCFIFLMTLMFGPHKVFFTLVKCLPSAISSVAFLHGRPRFLLNTTELGVSPTGKVTPIALCFLLALSVFTLEPALTEAGIFSEREARAFLFEDDWVFSLEDDGALPFLGTVPDSWAL